MNGTYRWTPDEKPGDKFSKKFHVKQDGKKIVRTMIIAVLAMVLVVAGLTCFYTVDDKQQAVVTTFGKVTSIADAGVHFKLPFGIQQVDKVDVNAI